MSEEHKISFKTYSNVLIVLLVLTVVTVAVAQVDFGKVNALVAMLIATIKAILVLMYFMHLKYDEKIYWIIFGSAVFFVMLLYFFSELDIITRVIQNSVL
ncbi:MAG: cytochrome C oxidase subunit IV family protein [Bdellovibrionaceae bacterium]|nr:cytochrome C oxidase subunit IV family protein [Pseudobdellovibrionaceae bacterium]